jgi:hypothetical protein
MKVPKEGARPFLSLLFALPALPCACPPDLPRPPSKPSLNPRWLARRSTAASPPRRCTPCWWRPACSTSAKCPSPWTQPQQRPAQLSPPGRTSCHSR